jgi:hypothetical protein
LRRAVRTRNPEPWWAATAATQSCPTGQQFYPPIVDPYDANHLLLVGHGVDLLVESTDGGLHWNQITTDPRMAMMGGTGGPEFVNTGDPATTRTTWLFLTAQTGGKVGTWRTTDSGKTWTQVDKNEHTNGSTQTFQPDTKGTIFMAGVYSGLGWGVLRSTDYGVTWAHVGNTEQETIVFGTSKHVYALFGWGIGPGGTFDPNFEMADEPGTGTWSKPGVPAGMTQGPAEAAVTNDGKNNILLIAGYNAGLWRYIEP